MEHFGLDALSENVPITDNRPPSNFRQLSASDQVKWFLSEVGKLYDDYVTFDYVMRTVGRIAETDDLAAQIKSMRQQNGSYICKHCAKIYKSEGWMRKHLQSNHGETMVAQRTGLEQEQRSSTESSNDELGKVRSSFFKSALLLFDTNNAYEMGDGHRILMNAKFELLVADACGHTHYRRWLWRLMANEQAILSPRKAFEYKWNTTVNTRGGTGKNIPNDNLVEITVKNIKEMVSGLGSNIDFEKIRLCARIILEEKSMVESLMAECEVDKHFGTGSEPDKKEEIGKLVHEMKVGNFFTKGQAHSFEGFEKFVDVFCRTDFVSIQRIIQKFKSDEKVKIGK